MERGVSLQLNLTVLALFMPIVECIRDLPAESAIFTAA